jgi:hypothetical protein
MFQLKRFLLLVFLWLLASAQPKAQTQTNTPEPTRSDLGELFYQLTVSNMASNVLLFRAILQNNLTPSPPQETAFKPTPTPPADTIRERPMRMTICDHVPTMSADKMNVFYIGVDNPITCSITGIRADSLKMSISGNGSTIRNYGDGSAIVRLSSLNKVIVNLVATDRDGKKVSGSKEFRVKYIPDPLPKLGGKNGGTMGAGEFKAQLGLIADLPEFDFYAKFLVVSFDLTVLHENATIQTCTNKGAKFTGTCATLIDQAKPNSVYLFSNIKAVGPDGRTRQLGTIGFTITQ